MKQFLIFLAMSLPLILVYQNCGKSLEAIEFASDGSNLLDLDEKGLVAEIGSGFGCKTTEQKTVECWGDNQFGRLGCGSNIQANDSVSVVGLTDVRKLAVGHFHACAIAGNTRTLSCWGKNEFGQLGDGTSVDSNRPRPVSSLGSVKDVAVGYGHTCAVTTEGRVACWGQNSNGQLGLGDTNNRNVATLVANVYGSVAVTAASSHTCALNNDGLVSCWGLNDRGQLGRGSVASTLFLPGQVVGVESVVGISSGGAQGLDSTCAVNAAGEVFCWGNNMFCQINRGNESGIGIPSRIPELPAVRSLSVGIYNTCAITTVGEVFCWGNITFSDNPTTTLTCRAPTRIPGLAGIRTISTMYSSLAVDTQASEIFEWGSATISPSVFGH